MSNLSWQRRRHPDDVPTPVAIAVADYCRRAQSPSPPAVVREALALLGDDDDFRVTALTEQEPEATPLGPFALVDLISGAEPELAARRQETGYYEVARELAELRAQGASAPSPSEEMENAPARASAPRPSAPAKRTRRKTLTVAEKIAPKKHVAPEPTPPPRPPPPSVPRLRQLPEPRGRFTRLEPHKASFDDLLGADGLELLKGAVEQTGNRVALWRALSPAHSGPRGRNLTVGDVEEALRHHRLLARLEKLERESLLASLTDNRGALGRTAHALGMSRGEQEQVIGALSLAREVKEIRERFSREALAGRNLALRLDLLGRVRYLEDLGIVKAFDQALERDLKAVLKQASADADPKDLIAVAARQHGLNEELLVRAIEKLGLKTP